MIRIHRRIAKAVTVLTLMTFVLAGCTSEANNIGNAQELDGKTDVVDTGFQLTTVGSFDSADTAVVLSTDLNNKAVTFINMDTGKQYTLYYDGTTYVQNKHDGPMTISQIKAGDIVDVTFLKGKKKLASIKLSSDAWVYDDVYNYNLAGSNGTASIGSQIYSLPDGVVVLSEGRRMETGEVVDQDIVTISGIDHKIYSVNVNKGHGYLRLKNDQALLGGWIEVGNKVIRQITEDMLLIVPEGSYQVALTNKNVGCVKEVTVERDKEVVLDVSDLEIAEDAVGKILFTVTPETAKVSVDGKPVDISKVVELPYGIHQVQAEAGGYDTLTRHIQVGSEYASISFKLEESRQPDENRNSLSENSTSRTPWKDTLDSINVDNSPKSVSSNTLSTLSENALGTSSNYKVYIDSPEGVEVYLDGNYIGLSPVRFTKTVGSHQITLKKSGYKTKSYTIYLENNKKDETYSFSALEKENSGSSNDDNSSSGGSTGVPPQGIIPPNIAGAVSSISNLTFTDGIEVVISDGVGTLNDAGKTAIEAAVKTAVETAVNAEEAEKYTYAIESKLTDVQEPAEVDGSGKVLVTIFRSGYKEQNTSVNVKIKKQMEENPPVQEQNISVTITSDLAEVEEGGTVKFTATVNNENGPIEGAKVSWKVENEETGINDNELSVSVNDGETRESLTVTATYTDAGGKSYTCDKTVAIKKKNSELGNGENEGNNTNIPKVDEPDLETSEDSITKEPENSKSDKENESAVTDLENNNGSDDLKTETVTINQNAHPIRKFFSSLFKK